MTAASRLRAAALGVSALLAVSGLAYLKVTDYKREEPVTFKPSPPPPNAILDVVYGTVDGVPLQLDVFHPSRRAPVKARPAILLLHGGAWRSGTRREMTETGVALAKAGFVCFSADYRLVENGQNRYPAALDDARRAVRWIRSNAAKYGVDQRFVGAVGTSAGGQLAALLGTRETNPAGKSLAPGVSGRVQAVVDLCGINDLTRYVDSTPNWAYIVTEWIGETPQKQPRLFREATPITWVSRTSAPFLLVHGGQDQLVPLEQSQRMLGALKRAKVPASLLLFPRHGHGVPQGASFNAFIQNSTRFFRRHLQEKNGAQAPH